MCCCSHVHIISYLNLKHSLNFGVINVKHWHIQIQVLNLSYEIMISTRSECMLLAPNYRNI